jgi:hypothetical protein
VEGHGERDRQRGERPADDCRQRNLLRRLALARERGPISVGGRPQRDGSHRARVSRLACPTTRRHATRWVARRRGPARVRCRGRGRRDARSAPTHTLRARHPVGDGSRRCTRAPHRQLPRLARLGTGRKAAQRRSAGAGLGGSRPSRVGLRSGGVGGSCAHTRRRGHGRRRRSRRCRRNGDARRGRPHWSGLRLRQEEQRIDVAVRVGTPPDAEVDVRHRELRYAARPDRPDPIALGHDRPALDLIRPQVHERDGVAVLCLDRHSLATGRNDAGEGDGAARGGDHRRARHCADVDPAVLSRGVRIRAEGERPQNRAPHRPAPRPPGGRRDQRSQDHNGQQPQPKASSRCQ